MFTKKTRTPFHVNEAEKAEEIIGILLAISVVSKRMATKLTQLENLRGNEVKNGKRSKATH